MWPVWLGSFLGTALGFTVVYCVFRYCVRLNNLILFGKFSRTVDLADFGLRGPTTGERRVAKTASTHRTTRRFHH